jgi:hypothetical protein
MMSCIFSHFLRHRRQEVYYWRKNDEISMSILTNREFRKNIYDFIGIIIKSIHRYKIKAQKKKTIFYVLDFLHDKDYRINDEDNSNIADELYLSICRCCC